MTGFLSGLRAKRAQVVEERELALACSEAAAVEVKSLERQIVAAKERQADADGSALRAMERIETLDKTIAAFADEQDEPASEALKTLAALPVGSTWSVAGLVREHLAARPGRNFTARELSDILWETTDARNNVSSPKNLTAAVKTALASAHASGLARKVETTRGIAYQANKAADSAAQAH